MIHSLSTGAGGCIGGSAAPQPGHGGSSSGDVVTDGGFTLAAVASTDTPGEFTVTLSGETFKGFLFRTVTGTTIVDTGVGQEASICTDAVGVTHQNPDAKTEAVAVFEAPAGATSAVIDVSVVVALSEYYYTGLTVDLSTGGGGDESPAPTATPDTTPAPPAATEAPTGMPVTSSAAKMMGAIMAATSMAVMSLLI